jgi:hypothetical protein
MGVSVLWSIDRGERKEKRGKRIKIKAGKLGSWEANLVIWVTWVYGVPFRKHGAESIAHGVKSTEFKHLNPL